MKKMKIIIAVTGASGSIYARTLLHQLYVLRLSNKIQVGGVVFSEKGKEVWVNEIGTMPVDLPFTIYGNDNFNVPVRHAA